MESALISKDTRNSSPILMAVVSAFVITCAVAEKARKKKSKARALADLFMVTDMLFVFVNGVIFF
jgi:hypothetical protein